MDNSFNEEKREFDPSENSEPARDAEYEACSDSPQDAVYEPVSPGIYRYTPQNNDSKRKKDKKPLTWGRIIPWMIGIGVGSFVIGVLVSVFLLFPVLGAADSFEFKFNPDGFKEFGNFDEFEDFFEHFTDPEAELPKAEEGTKKEAESFTDHPTELPEIGGELPAITDQLNPVPDIAEQLADGIVLIKTELTMQYGNGEEETNEVSGGTGFVISEDGYIVTNNHVIDQGSSYLVIFPDGTEYSAALVGTDTETDLAVLKIEPKNKLTVLAIGDSDKVRTGEMVIAIGNATGAGEMLTGSVTVGYVSAANREISFNGTKQPFIQTDAALNSGNSGGPLVNTKGEVVGVATLKSLISSYTAYGETVNSEGIGFAIPINRAMEKVQQIILSGSIEKPGIGLYYYELTEEYCKQEGIPEGLMIDSFMTGSPSEEAGLKVGDIITEVDGKDIKEIEAISDYIVSKGIGETVKFKVYRDGEYLDFTVNIKNLNAMR